MNNINYSDWVGKQVSKTALNRKPTPKPFKSGNKCNTVKGVTINPYSNKVGFIFEEDDSIVDAHICELVYKH